MSHAADVKTHCIMRVDTGVGAILRCLHIKVGAVLSEHKLC